MDEVVYSQFIVSAPFTELSCANESERPDTRPGGHSEDNPEGREVCLHFRYGLLPHVPLPAANKVSLLHFLSTKPNSFNVPLYICKVLARD